MQPLKNVQILEWLTSIVHKIWLALISYFEFKRHSVNSDTKMSIVQQAKKM